jgi:rhodanese-related sulfurtransferase
MQPNLFTFLQNNIFLVLVCVASGVMLIWPLIQKALSGSKEVSVPQAVQLINRRDAVVIDVREAAEYAAGHLPNARHIPGGEIDKRLKEIEKFKQRPIVVVCQTGNRSAAACGRLRKNGFAEAYNLKGGILGWQQASMPIEK